MNHQNQHGFNRRAVDEGEAVPVSEVRSKRAIARMVTLQNNTNQIVLDFNADRRGASIFNNTGGVVYVLLAEDTECSDQWFTFKMDPAAGSTYYETPFKYCSKIYAYGAAGKLAVTEYL